MTIHASRFHPKQQDVARPNLSQLNADRCDPTALHHSSLMEQFQQSEETRPSRSTGLLDLPPEIFQWMVNKMGRRDRASLLRVCKETYAFTAEPLYRRTYTKRGTASDISALPEFFTRRPDLIRYIKVMVIDEYDEAAMRRLLSISFPNLQSILMQHDGDVEKTMSEEDKVLQNERIVLQPKFKNRQSPPTTIWPSLSRHLTLSSDLLDRRRCSGAPYPDQERSSTLPSPYHHSLPPVLSRFLGLERFATIHLYPHRSRYPGYRM